jgi:glucoamylase
MVGYIEVTPVSLKFWKLFDDNIAVTTYRKGTPGYKVLTDHVRKWVNKIVLQLAKATPDDYVLVECIDKETGGPYGPRGMIRSLAAALGVIDAYKGLIPPNWGHDLEPKSSGIPASHPVHNAHADCHVCNQQTYDRDVFWYPNLDD